MSDPLLAPTDAHPSDNSSGNGSEDSEVTQPKKVFEEDTRRWVSDTTSLPYSAVVLVGVGDGNGRCTGVLIDAFHALTAAHCVHDDQEWGGNISATHLRVYPGATNASLDGYAPYGRVGVREVTVYGEYADSEELGYDIALLELDRDVGDFAGIMPLYDSAGSGDPIYTRDDLELAGYPGDKQADSFEPLDSSMWTAVDEGLSATDLLHQYLIDMEQGQSGGPVWATVDSTPRVVSINVQELNPYNEGTRINDAKYADITAWRTADTPPTNRPDLTPRQLFIDGANESAVVSTQGTVHRGSDITVTVGVRNAGTAASGCFDVTLSALNPDTFDSFRLGKTEVCSLSAFSTRRVSVTGTIPEDIPLYATYTLYWEVDLAGTITEFGEAGNDAPHAENDIVVRSTQELTFNPVLGAPTNPTPASDQSGVATDSTLSWRGNGTGITYDLYLSKGDETPALHVEGLTTTSYTPDLEQGTTYYWKVVAKDGNGHTAESEVWSFTTEVPPNDAPTRPTLSGPTEGVTGVAYGFRAVSTDSNGDPIHYVFDWGDGTSSRYPATGTVSSGIGADRSHVWTESGTYTVRVKAVDDGGLSSEWATTDIAIDQAQQSENIFAGKRVAGLHYVFDSESPPFASYSVGDYTMKTVAYAGSGGTAWVDIFRSGDRKLNDRDIVADSVYTFHNDQLTVYPKSISRFTENESADKIFESYYLLAKTDPSVVSAEPASPKVPQGGTVSIDLGFPQVTDPDSGVCSPEAFVFGDARGWLTESPAWVESISDAGDAKQIDGDCNAVADGAITIEVAVPTGTSPGTYTIDLIINSGKDAAFRMRNLEIQVHELNDPPTAPSSPTPSDGQTRVPTTQTLGWTGGDPNGDSVTYTVYLEKGDNTPDEILRTGLGSASVSPNGLELDSHYYWQVVATDEHGATTTGPVWSFVTSTRPAATFDHSPLAPAEGDEVTFDAAGSTDTDGSITAYEWDFDGDGMIDATGAQVTHTFASSGDYPVTLTVTDGDGLTDTVTTTVSVAHVNEPPAVNVTLVTTVNQAASPIEVKVNASDPDGQVTEVALSNPSGMTLNRTSCAAAECTVTLSGTPTTSTWSGTGYDATPFTVTVEDNSGAGTSETVQVRVYIAGDASGDGIVNIFDAVKVGISWNRERGHSGYSDAADLNNDGKVDIFDAVIIGTNWKAEAR